VLKGGKGGGGGGGGGEREQARKWGHGKFVPPEGIWVVCALTTSEYVAVF